VARRLALALALTLALTHASVGATTAGVESQSSPAASRIIDRTMICPMVGVGYPDSIRFLHVSATPFRREARYVDVPRAGVRNGGYGGPQVSVSLATRPGGSSTPGVWLSRPECPRTNLRVALLGKGLERAPFGGGSHRCDAPARVLIRIRAIFKRPTAFSRDLRFPTDYLVAKGHVSTGYLAVATMPQRNPIFFAAVNDATGKVRRFVAPSHCRGER
jgi:hypothetical protein